jgi:CRISPR-associated protein (TIGR02710 family)
MPEHLKSALVASVGTSPEPVLAGLNAARADGATAVFLVYGRAHPRQQPDPFSTASQVRQTAEERGISVSIYELPAPEDLDSSIDTFRSVFREVAALGVERVIVDFTGGTKVMSAALLLAALGHLSSFEVVPQYVGGEQRNAHGRVEGQTTVKRATRVPPQELARQVIECLRDGHYSYAEAFAQGLPDAGRHRFLKKATTLLYLWDDFQYEQALVLATGLHETCATLADDATYCRLADTVARLRRAGGHIKATLDRLVSLQNNPLAKAPHPQPVWAYLALDALENARRRFAESRFTDCVLRAYRAVEVATQFAIIGLGINPWHPKWEKLNRELLSSYLNVIGLSQPPRVLSLFHSISLIECLASHFEEQVKDDLKSIMNLRNFSYLEHGYNAVNKEDAATALIKTEKAITAILAKAGLDVSLTTYTAELKHEC